MALHQPVQPSAEALKQGYEPEGVSYAALVGALLSVALVIAIFMGIAVWLLLTLVHRNREAEALPSAVPTVPVYTGLPPLQPSPGHDTTDAEDLTALKKHEDDVFAELGWKMGTDQKRQVPDNILSAIAAREAQNQVRK